MGFSLGGLLQQAGNAVNPVLKLAAVGGKFIPGMQGVAPIAGALSGLISAADSDRKARKASSSIENRVSALDGIMEGDLATYSKLSPEIMNKLVASVMNPADSIAPQYRQALQAGGDRYAQGADRLTRDFARRGLSLGNSGMTGGLSQLRAGIEQGNADALSDLIANEEASNVNRLTSAVGALGSLRSGVTQTALSNNQTMGGLRGLYGSETEAFGDALTGLVTEASKTIRPKTAGNATLATNKKPSPVMDLNASAKTGLSVGTSLLRPGTIGGK